MTTTSTGAPAGTPTTPATPTSPWTPTSIASVTLGIAFIAALIFTGAMVVLLRLPALGNIPFNWIGAISITLAISLIAIVGDYLYRKKGLIVAGAVLWIMATLLLIPAIVLWLQAFNAMPNSWPGALEIGLIYSGAFVTAVTLFGFYQAWGDDGKGPLKFVMLQGYFVCTLAIGYFVFYFGTELLFPNGIPDPDPAKNIADAEALRKVVRIYIANKIVAMGGENIMLALGGLVAACFIILVIRSLRSGGAGGGGGSTTSAAGGGAKSGGVNNVTMALLLLAGAVVVLFFWNDLAVFFTEMDMGDTDFGEWLDQRFGPESSAILWIFVAFILTLVFLALFGVKNLQNWFLGLGILAIIVTLFFVTEDSLPGGRVQTTQILNDQPSGRVEVRFEKPIKAYRDPDHCLWIFPERGLKRSGALDGSWVIWELADGVSGPVNTTYKKVPIGESWHGRTC